MPRIAIILVHYHTAKLLVGAVEALLADLSGSQLQAELIVVDNGSTEAERMIFQDLPVRYIDAGSNLGYAGGLNLGVKQTDADFLFFMNCDVEVLPGCISVLAQMLRQGAAAAGPRFYWDRQKTVLLPPTEERDLVSEVLRRVAGCSRNTLTWATAHWRRHARKHWLAREAFPSAALSGALLAVRRDAWTKIGSFDEGFKLYYEETDWLLRMQRHGLKSYYVPAAEAVHFFNQSAAQEPKAAAWCAASARRFQLRHYGKVLTTLLDQLPTNVFVVRQNVSHLSGGLREINASFSGRISGACRWVEISPLMAGFPATGSRIAAGETWSLPEDLWDHLAPGTYYVRALDGEDRGLDSFSFDVERRTSVLSGGLHA